MRSNGQPMSCSQVAAYCDVYNCVKRDCPQTCGGNDVCSGTPPNVKQLKQQNQKLPEEQIRVRKEVICLNKEHPERCGQ